MFGLRKRERAIVDYDFTVGDGWHGVELHRGTDPRWAEDLAGDVLDARAAFGDAGRRGLVSELRAVQARLVGADEPGVLAAVMISVDGAPRVTCAAAWRVTNRQDGETPESYRTLLTAGDLFSAPGERTDVVTTWRATIDIGVAVGAYNMIIYSDPGTAVERTEARTVIAVFIAQSSQILEFVFTTQDHATYEDLLELSMDSVASLTVELAK